MLAQAPRFTATKSSTTPHPSTRLIESPPVSAEPAFTALVVFDLAVRLAAPDLGEAEVELLDVGILAQGVGGALQHDPAVLHHVTVIGDGQRQGRVLLDQ